MLQSADFEIGDRVKVVPIGQLFAREQAAIVIGHTDRLLLRLEFADGRIGDFPANAAKLTCRRGVALEK